MFILKICLLKIQIMNLQPKITLAEVDEAYYEVLKWLEPVDAKVCFYVQIKRDAYR